MLKLRPAQDPDTEVSGDATGVTIDAIRSGLSSKEIHFFVQWRLYNENAITMASPRRVSLQPRRLALWRSGRLLDRSGLVDTLAHELTHIVLSEGDGGYQIIQDRGYSEKSKTFSYAFGWAAGAVFVAAEIGPLDGG